MIRDLRLYRSGYVYTILQKTQFGESDGKTASGWSGVRIVRRDSKDILGRNQVVRRSTYNGKRWEGPQEPKSCLMHITHIYTGIYTHTYIYTLRENPIPYMSFV